ncbi:MAG: permease prefix domain 1-containing protein [Terriglobia bacterium]
MPDTRGLLKKCLGELGLAPHREEEILRELADHLEDHATALEARGITDEQAFQEALSGVGDWPKFREEIHRAETEEATMNYQVTYRTKVLWLPALGALTLRSGLLALFQFLGLVPRFYWLSGIGIPFYLPWLIALPAIGAVAAFWSQRAGGKAVHRLLAALAPPIGMLGTFLIGPFIGLLIYLLIPLFSDGAGHRRTRFPLHAPPMIGVFLMLASWVLLPAVGLLLGAVPFLRSHEAQS